MRNRLVLALLGAAIGVLPGCRSLTSIQDHPSKNVTIISTLDADLFSTSTRYWQCQEDAQKLTCRKVCDAGNGIECQRLFFGYSNTQ